VGVLETEVRELRIFIERVSYSDEVVSEYIGTLTDAMRKIRMVSENI